MADLSRQNVPPCVMTIFGASGDLTKRLLLPSLYNLAAMKALPDGFRLVGVARAGWSDDKFRDYVTENLKEFWGADAAPETLDWLTKRASYVNGNFDDPALFDSLKQAIEKLERDGQPAGNRMFYLAVAPSFICVVAEQLSRVGLLTEEEGKWRRLVTEKPFGEDYASAKALNQDLQKSLREDQIYRIDHFAGKDSVQDLSVFRFSNAIFESFWNRSAIDNVQITAAEIVGVEGRAGYYETSGALRDMVPNHLAEILSLIAMEPPVSFNAAHMRVKQTDVLESIRRIGAGEVDQNAVRGQYGAGSMNGKAVPAYRSEPKVQPDSNTDTYAAAKIWIDNWRWTGVPFYLRTGKRLASATTEVVVTFKSAPARLFPGVGDSSPVPNQLLFSLGRDPGIKLQFGAKAPGLTTMVQQGALDFQLAGGPFGDHGKGYERLLHDIMLGDATLFPGADFIEQGWLMVQPLLDAWTEPPKEPFPNYAAGSAGPKSSDDMLAVLGHTWHSLEKT